MNIGSDCRIAMNNIKLGVEMEIKTIDDQETTKSRYHTDRIKEDLITTRIQKPIRAKQELDDIDTMSETITDMVQHSAPRVAKTINKPWTSRISSPTRALVNGGKWRQ